MRESTRDGQQPVRLLPVSAHEGRRIALRRMGTRAGYQAEGVMSLREALYALNASSLYARDGLATAVVGQRTETAVARRCAGT